MPRPKRAQKDVPRFVTRRQLLEKRNLRVLQRSDVKTLDLGRMNEIFGDGENGLPDGTILEVSGDSSAGKSTMMLDLAAAAQAAGMTVLWADFENSFQQKWAARRGVVLDNPLLFELFSYEALEKLGAKTKAGGRRVAAVQTPTVEEIFDSMEEYVIANHKLDKTRRFFIVCDSIAAMATDVVVESKSADANMRTKMDLPSFMSQLMKKWMRITAVHAITLAFINQLRVKPGVMFGDPAYTPGGNAVPFFAHVRVRMKRVRLLRKDGKPYGVAGIMRLFKSKIGGAEGTELGYKLFWRSGRTKLVRAASLFKKA